MAAGQSTFRLILLEADDGTALSYADKAAFEAAGFAIGTFRNRAGTAFATQPTWTLADVGAGVHRIVLDAEPVGEWYAPITQPAGAYCNAVALRGLGEAYTNAALASLIISSLGTPGTGATGAGVGSPASGELDDWVQGDDYVCFNVQVPQAALDKIGATGLDDAGLSFLCAAKQPWPTKNAGDTEEITFTVTVQNVASRLVKISAAWSEDYALGTAQFRTYIVDLSLVKSTEQTTARQDQLTIVWQADTR